MALQYFSHKNVALTLQPTKNFAFAANQKTKQQKNFDFQGFCDISPSQLEVIECFLF